MESKTCDVSVVIPVYNSGPFLRRCLDSVLEQTLKSIEVICVDDGSVDDSLEILREYARMDSRIHIIELAENHGLSFARNEGMDLASGTRWSPLFRLSFSDLLSSERSPRHRRSPVSPTCSKQAQTVLQPC